MIEPASVVRLAQKARLRFDRHSGEHMILYPERGLSLSTTAAEIVALIDGKRSIAAMADALAEKYGEANRAAIENDVLVLLRDLAGRGLLDEVAS